MMIPIAAEISPLWEVVKGIMLFVITGCAAYMARKFMGMVELVRDHDREIYGKDGQNGLKRGLNATIARVDLIEDRNTAIDAVAAAEVARYQGPDRRHAALKVLTEMVRHELEEGK